MKWFFIFTGIALITMLIGYLYGVIASRYLKKKFFKDDEAA